MLKLKIILQSNKTYLILLFICLIYAFIRIDLIKYNSKLNLNLEYYEGVIDNIKYQNKNYTITLKLEEKIICYYYEEKELNFKLGDKLRVYGKLKEPKQNTIPNTFSYKKYLNNKHIYYILKASKVEKIGSSNNFIYKIKNYIISKINKYQTKNYLKAFIIGDKSELEEYATYQINGVSHLFAISGMHISLLSGILLFVLKKNKFKNIIVIIFLIMFMLITNFSGGIYRSVIFFILLKLNNYFDLKITTKNILILTLSILIIYDPLLLFDIGIIYSFIVSLGLIISRKYYKKNYLYNLLITSIIAFLFSMPITLIYNYEINLMTILNNMIIVPLISLIIYPLSLIVFIIPFLEPLLIITINILELINNNLLVINIIIPKVSIIIYFIYYLILLLFIKSNNYKFLVLNLILLLSLKLKPLLNNNTYIYFLDVAQGDSTLIYSPKETILIDTGGVNNYNVSDNTIKFIKSLGIAKIDLLLLTHGDADHIKDAPNIINKLKVKNVMINNNQINDLEKLVIKTNVHLVKEYQSKLNLKIYNNFISKDENASSIIALLNINNYQILFMGDAPKSEELLLLNKEKIKADIIKIGHHGSKTSSDELFLKKIKVKEAIISSSINNIYHFPHKDTISSLNKLKIKYYNTASNGTISYKFGRINYTIYTYPP